MNLKELDTGAANPTLNRNRVHPIPAPWPDVAEQSRIVEVLDDRLAHSSAIEEHVTRSTARLREYRQALITAAVTGQIDVSDERAVAAHDERVDALGG